MLRKPSCPWCLGGYPLADAAFALDFAEILVLREWAVHQTNTDESALLDAELVAMGYRPPANDNEPRSEAR